MKDKTENPAVLKILDYHRATILLIKLNIVSIDTLHVHGWFDEEQLTFECQLWCVSLFDFFMNNKLEYKRNKVLTFMIYGLGTCLEIFRLECQWPYIVNLSNRNASRDKTKKQNTIKLGPWCMGSKILSIVKTCLPAFLYNCISNLSSVLSCNAWVICLTLSSSVSWPKRNLQAHPFCIICARW